MNSKNPFIVIVEDEEMLREAANEKFKYAGYKTAAFANGLEMLANISEMEPDVVLLDIMTPEIDGLGVLESLRNNFKKDRFKKVKIVVWSNISDKSTIERARRLGAYEYLPKIDYVGDRLVERIGLILNIKV